MHLTPEPEDRKMRRESRLSFLDQLPGTCTTTKCTIVPLALDRGVWMQERKIKETTRHTSACCGYSEE